jgi:gliding motility-associated-like protein
MGDVISTQTIVVVDSVGTYILRLTNSKTGCASTDTASVTTNGDELGIISISVADENCFGDEDGVVEIMNITGGSPPYAYELNGMSTTSTGLFDHLAPGQYNLHILDAEGCSIDTIITIHAGINLQVELPEFLQVKADQYGNIQAIVNVPEADLSSVQWTPLGVVLCDTCLSTMIYTHHSQKLTVTVIHVSGCTASATLDIQVIPTPKIYIPNTFSPNGDGFNDQFTVYTNDGVTSIIELNIYNRWGEHLFRSQNVPSNDPSFGWDGKFHQREVPSGTFVYMLKVLLADGTEKMMAGDVTLLR